MIAVQVAQLLADTITAMVCFAVNAGISGICCICSDRSIPASITYRFNEGGMDRVRVSVAILSESIEVRNQVNITIRPYVDESCSPPPTPTTLSDKNFDTMKNGMEHVEIEYDVGLLPQLNCELAKFVQIKFWAPEGSEAQIMSVKLIGDGEINGLQELANPNDNPQQQSGLFDNDLVIYILIGVGAVFLLVMLALVWVCCGRPCCCGSKDAVCCSRHNSLIISDFTAVLCTCHILKCPAVLVCTVAWCLCALQ